ncbi:pantetheine-phosphate adenylyltransferase [Candidatus Gottesmanbacteria bacterium]|nr:pantetheine-phosphate adenylyltransferase [Candidatus Gottesmanbacteria bacterium]
MFHRVFIAGTFDGLHRGHEAVLTRAFAEGERVTVGITTDTFAKRFKNYDLRITKFEERKSALERWIKKKGWRQQATIIPIEDRYEPAASDRSLNALIVTSQNKTTGEAINDMRNKRGLTGLVLLEVPMVAADDGQPISSTRTRNGEITASGKFLLPDALRPELTKPLGKLLVGSAIGETLGKLRGRTVVTVGDVATKTFLDAGITPSLAIFDLRVGRKPSMELSALSKGKHIASGPGFISQEAIAAIGAWAENLASKGVALKGSPSVIVIDGEEDLLVLPAVLAAPLESMVYYGQPPLRPSTKARDYEEQAGQGVVEIEVTIEKKKDMMELLAKFEEGSSE